MRNRDFSRTLGKCFASAEPGRVWEEGGDQSFRNADQPTRLKLEAKLNSQRAKRGMKAAELTA